MKSFNGLAQSWNVGGGSNVRVGVSRKLAWELAGNLFRFNRCPPPNLTEKYLADNGALIGVKVRGGWSKEKNSMRSSMPRASASVSAPSMIPKFRSMNLIILPKL